MKTKSKLKGMALVFIMVFSILCVEAFAVSITLNPNDKSANLTLSNGNLTVTGASGLVRATQPIPAGAKVYWEVKLNGYNGNTFGIASSDVPLTTRYLMKYYITTGQYRSVCPYWVRKYSENEGGIATDGLAYGISPSSGMVYGFAVDRVNGTITMYQDGVSQGVMYSNINNMGSIYPAYTGDTSSDSATFNFGATPFAYSVPAGHTSLNNALALPSAPTNLTAVAGNAKVDLSWAAVTGATGYNVKRATTAGGPYTTIVPSVVGATYADTTVKNGTTYYYVVSAINANGESVNSSEVSATPISPAVTLDITSIDTAKVGYEIIADVVIHNANNICAEDIRINYDTNLLEYIGAVNADGMKVYSETDLTNGGRRYITASLGKANAANGDKILLKLKFKAKSVGQAKIDITSGRIADNATLEADVAPENCGEKIITIETTKDVNRTGEFTLLDLGIDAWYFGDAASATDTTKYDADVVVNNTIDDGDLSDIVSEMLKNTNYVANK